MSNRKNDSLKMRLSQKACHPERSEGSFLRFTSKGVKRFFLRQNDMRLEEIRPFETTC